MFYFETRLLGQNFEAVLTAIAKLAGGLVFSESCKDA